MYGLTECIMAQLTFREAIARGIAQEMRRDESVVFLGEDVGGRRRVQSTVDCWTSLAESVFAIHHQRASHSCAMGAA